MEELVQQLVEDFQDIFTPTPKEEYFRSRFTNVIDPETIYTPRGSTLLLDNLKGDIIEIHADMKDDTNVPSLLFTFLYDCLEEDQNKGRTSLGPVYLSETPEGIPFVMSVGYFSYIMWMEKGRVDQFLDEFYKHIEEKYAETPQQLI